MRERTLGRIRLQGQQPRQRGAPAMRRILALMLTSGTLAATAVTIGCTSTSSTHQPAGTSHSPVTSPTNRTAAGLVGRWERVLTCQELVNELGKAGLGSLTPYAWRGQTSSTGVSSFASGSPKPTKAHPCPGALNRMHSHFFSQSGQFGSLDWLGAQVDNGPYRIINNNTVYIGSPPAERHSTTASCTATRSCCPPCSPRPCLVKRSRIRTSSARRAGPCQSPTPGTPGSVSRAKAGARTRKIKRPASRSCATRLPPAFA
jgi:hypothetical protein